MVHSPVRRVTLAFLGISTSIAFCHDSGENPPLSRMRAARQSTSVMVLSLEPAFMVAKDSAQGKHEVSSLALLQKRIWLSREISNSCLGTAEVEHL
jgi:hypothetical protein